MPQAINKTRVALGSRHARLIVFLIFLSLTALFGGGSRADIQSLILLRPLAALACGYAFVTLSPAQLGAVRVPLAFLLAFGLLHLLQLVPLPPDLWHGLPKRDAIVEIERTLGLSDVWRPLTLSPARTWNSFFALLVPLAALLLFAALDVRDRSIVFVWLVAFAAISAIVGILQLLGGSNSPFYTYRITNLNFPVGLFANRNHQGVLLAMAVFVLTWMIAGASRWRLGVRAVVPVAGALIVLMTILAFVTGSRAGLALTVLAALAGLVLLMRSPLADARLTAFRGRELRGRWAIGAFAGLLVCMGIGAVALSRDAAFARLMAESDIAGLRGAILPTLLHMVGDQFVLGTGFGSFEAAYQVYEPYSLLQTQYLNQAHDDWLQLAIEGGLPALLLLAGVLVWLGARAWRLRRRLWAGETQALPALAILMILAAASALDYPLHVPVIAALAALMVAIIAAAPVNAASEHPGGAAS